MSQLFSSFQDYFNKEQDVREEIRNVTKELELCVRDIQILLQVIHSEDGIQQIDKCCVETRELLGLVREKYDKLKVIVPVNEYYRYNDHWRHVTQQLSFIVALVTYLESGRLVTREEFAEALGVQPFRGQGFHIDLEDYLMGLLQLASELSRFAINSVTNGDFSRPMHISKFVAELSAGFRMLNLKNDFLRKRFDALKYDVKKIEQVVYDLSVRGLRQQAVTASDTDSSVK